MNRFILGAAILILSSSSWNEPSFAQEIARSEELVLNQPASLGNKNETSSLQQSDIDLQNGTEAASNTTFEQINIAFRQNYMEAKKRIGAKLGPLIIAGNGKLVLIWQGNRREIEYVPMKYSMFKTMDHISLALFVLLQDRTESPLDESTKAVLKNWQDKIDEARGALMGYKFESDEASTRQRDMLAECRGFIGQCLLNGKVSAADLKSFCRQQAKPSLENAYDAVSLELANLEKIVQYWRKEMGPDQWEKIHVIILSGHMMRTEERTFQYFQALLEEKEEGGRIIYAENFDEAKGLDLLLTHILDERISQNYFDNSWRMHKDLLADAASQYLKRHPPQSPGFRR